VKHFLTEGLLASQGHCSVEFFSRKAVTFWFLNGSFQEFLKYATRGMLVQNSESHWTEIWVGLKIKATLGQEHHLLCSDRFKDSCPIVRRDGTMLYALWFCTLFQATGCGRETGDYKTNKNNSNTVFRFYNRSFLCRTLYLRIHFWAGFTYPSDALYPFGNRYHTLSNKHPVT